MVNLETKSRLFVCFSFAQTVFFFPCNQEGARLRNFLEYITGYISLLIVTSAQIHILKILDFLTAN